VSASCASVFRRAVLSAALWLAALGPSLAGATPTVDNLRRLERGRFSILHAPADTRLATSFAETAVARDSFPGLPRPTERVEIWIAPDDDTFRRWVGGGAPEWGQAFAFPTLRRVVMHGRGGGGADDPLEVLRHELAHLALHEALGDLPPRWFDEGYASYAAGEWGREEVLATNFALAIAFGRLPTLARLDSSFFGGATTAQSAYAFSYRAVAEMAALDRVRGLTLLFTYWKQERSLERALRQAYGLTLGGFEMHWQKATRRRYGGLALVTDVSAGAILLGLMVGPLWWSRRRRDRRRLEAMRASDAAQAERDRASALAALLGEDTPKGEH
jgi:hypothetical protein